MSAFYDIVTKQRARTQPAGEGKFGAKIATFDGGAKAVLKIRNPTGQMFRGVPVATFHRREVAAYRLDRDLLKLGVVPETLLINWQGHESSLQKFVQGVQPKELVPGVFDRKLDDWKERVARFADLVNQEELVKVVVLDLVINNADRHARNLVIDTFDRKVAAIDNGTSFGPNFYMFKDIFYKYLFAKNFDIPEHVLSTLSAITLHDVKACLGSLVSTKEAEFTYWRIRFIVDHHDRLAFARVAQGNFNNNEFPTYSHWFEKKMYPRQELSLLTVPVRPGVVEQRLDKGFHQAVIAGALAISQLASSGMAGHIVKHSKPHVLKVNKASAGWDTTGLHSDLFHIAQLETHGGKFMNHKTHSSGSTFKTAYGLLGLKPETAHEQFMKDKGLQAEFGNLKDPSKFESALRSSNKLYNKTASSRWSYYLKRLGTPEKAAYAWRMGVGAALRASDGEINAHPYVKAFNAHRNAVKSDTAAVDAKHPLVG